MHVSGSRFQARNWQHGVFMGASMNSETTAAAAGKRGVLRADPFAMRPFCGYNMGDYFKHWLSFPERTAETKLPAVFHVNWFRKSSAGKFLWPGFGDNIRVIQWIFDRCDGVTNNSYVPWCLMSKEDRVECMASTRLAWLPTRD